MESNRISASFTQHECATTLTAMSLGGLLGFQETKISPTVGARGRAGRTLNACRYVFCAW